MSMNSPYKVIVKEPSAALKKKKIKPGRKHFIVIGPDGAESLRWWSNNSDEADSDCAQLNAAYAKGFAAQAREIEALQAVNAAMRGCLSKLHFHMKYWGSQEDGVPEEMYDDWKAALELVNSPNPGQPLLDKFSGLTTANELLVAACEKVMDRFGQYINPALALGERDKALASFTVGDRLDEQAWKAVVAALAATKEARL